MWKSLLHIIKWHATCKPCRAAGRICRVAWENISAYCILVVPKQGGARQSAARRPAAGNGVTKH
jgi:hypothetical protein